MRASELIAAAVRDRMAAEEVSPSNRVRVAELVRLAVSEWQQMAAVGHHAPLVDVERAEATLVNNLCGYGPIGMLFDPLWRVEEIFIEGDRVTYLRYGAWRVLNPPSTAAQSLHAIGQLLAVTDSVLDREHPWVDGQQVLGGRARLTAYIPPASPHLSVSMRFYVTSFHALGDLVDGGSMTPAAAQLLRLAVRAPLSTLISGQNGAGKTTLLAAMLATSRPDHCLRLMEESQEVQFTPLHGGRSQNVATRRDGTGGLDLRHQVRMSLRMRPDLCVVGEVRGPEAWDLARASRVGAGFMTTIHAPDAEAALEALVLLSLEAASNITETLIRRTFSASIDLVVHCARFSRQEEDPVRRITEIRAMGKMLGDDKFTSEPLFVRAGPDAPLEWTSALPHPQLTSRLENQLPKDVGIRDVLDGSWTEAQA